jgi:ELWxxDGT repeat protein
MLAAKRRRFDTGRQVGAWLLIGLGAATAVRGQTAYLVADLAPGGEANAASHPSHPVAAANHVFFLGNPQLRGRPSPDAAGGLWVTDGTAGGTRQLPCPGLCGGMQLISAGNLFYYTPDSGGELQLWRSDGTTAGTFEVSDDIGGDLANQQFGALGGVLYFTTYALIAVPNHYDKQLWRSDGTTAGTSLVASCGELPDFLQQDFLAAAGGKLFFLAPNGAGTDLWVSDGTSAGTAPLGLTGLRFSGLTTLGSRLFFIANGASQSPQIWVSDGTKAGTRKLGTFTSVGWLEAGGSSLYFTADDGKHGTQIWVSDGTPAGTRQATAAPSGFQFPLPSDQSEVVKTTDGFEVVGGKLVFLGTPPQGREALWSAPTGGAGSLVEVCRDRCGGFDSGGHLVKVGERVLFTNSGSTVLGVTDGTASGTRLLQQICGGSFCDPALALAGGALYFAVTENGFDQHLWRTDGTPAGTRRFADPLLDDTNQPAPVELHGKVFFVAADPFTNQGLQDELWMSDGTAAGTRQLTDDSGPRSSSPVNLTAAGDGVFLDASSAVDFGTVLWRSAGSAASTVALSPAAGPPVAAFGGVVFAQASSPGSELQLWRSDGTAAGTRPLTAFTSPLAVSFTVPPVASGGQVFFLVVLDSGGSGAIWKSDGTVPGTVQLVALPPAFPPVDSLAIAGNDLFLIVEVASSFDLELWKSDGTAAGTEQLVTFPNAGPLKVNPVFVQLGGSVYFSGPDGRLWQTDGTPAATVPVTGAANGFISDLVSAGGALYFFGNQALWRSDGTAAGTVLVQQSQNTSSLPGDPGGLTPFGGGLAFAADDGVHGYELWFTDGTAAGTRMVADIQAGRGASKPTGLTAAGGRLFFAADDGLHGSELWESDGTAAGTRMVQDIEPGPASSNPSGMTAAAGLLFFSADDGLTGQELWALPLDASAAGCRPSATALCLNGGRFKVEAAWEDSAGNGGAGQAVALTGDTGTFWFFSPDNVEVVVKVLDGRALDGHFWVFYGALSDVQYWLTVTDTQSGVTRRYFNLLGTLASAGDTQAFGPLGAHSIGEPASLPAAPAVPAVPAATRAKPATAGAGCQPGPLQLCLNGGRFAVAASWTDFSGRTGAGSAVPLTADTGYFWFFAAGNVETVLKVIDGRRLNGHFWVFYGALSNVQYTLTVTDTVTGVVKTYTNPAGQFASVADTSAF